MTSADDMAVMTSPRVDISRRNLERDGAWRRVEARDGVDGSWRRVAARGAREFLRRIFWWHVRARGSSNYG